ncbi:amidohydrolase family protein, partial [Methylobacillus flagellatus]|uniref:amidohydrolase family protein n=1 Tax=Methylobacillus flagellatus TaxID=405 RepID=UPI002853A391
LSSRLTLAHCIHARPDELEMIAEAGATIVTNPGSNLHLRSGIARIAEAHARGCRIAVGMDGLAFDEDDDIVREIRLAYALHAGLGFQRTFERSAFLMESIANGRASIGAPGTGRLAPGEAADLLLLDHDRLDRDAIMEIDPIDLFFARGTAAHIREVIVAGRTIVRDGQVVGVDIDAVESELRDLYGRQRGCFSALENAWPRIEPAVRHWFGSHGSCC